MSLRTTITDLERQRTDRIQEFLATYPDKRTERIYSRFLIGLADTEKSIHRAVMAASLAEVSRVKYDASPLKFSESLCGKFPVAIGRHVKTPENARWMLRNGPLTPLTDKDVVELKAEGWDNTAPYRPF